MLYKLKPKLTLKIPQPGMDRSKCQRSTEDNRRLGLSEKCSTYHKVFIWGSPAIDDNGEYCFTQLITA